MRNKCDNCPWKKLAMAWEQLHIARGHKGGREQMRLHEEIKGIKDELRLERESQRNS